MALIGREVSFNAPNRTIAALQYHSERVRQKNSDLPPDPRDILGAAVEHHHKSKSLLASTLRTESRGSSLIFREVDDFDYDDDDDDNEEPIEGKAPPQPHTPDQPPPAPTTRTVESPTAIKAAASVGSLTGKKAAQDDDPVAVLRRMRSQTVGRSVSTRVVDNGTPRGPTSGSMRVPIDQEDDDGVFKEAVVARGKSFLMREPQAEPSPADELLAQIRGPKWTGEGSKSAKSLPIKFTEPLTPAPRPNVSNSGYVNTGVPGLPASGSKSFSSSASARRSGAIPCVSVSDTPPSPGRTRTPVPPGPSRQATPVGASGGGFLSKLRQMVKH